MGLSRLLRACFAEPLAFRSGSGHAGTRHRYRTVSGGKATHAVPVRVRLGCPSQQASVLAIFAWGDRADPVTRAYIATPDWGSRTRRVGVEWGDFPPGSARAQVAGGLDWPGAGLAGAPTAAGMRAAGREPWPPGRFGAAIGLCRPPISAPSHSASWQLPLTVSPNKRAPLIIYRLLRYRNYYR